ncbi:hypothetical protein [Natronomonas sp. EA1]|uniref:hypothetical protein n=1 Tax=Natronomonas sp. EA1 TaxID=3421655 RepID=UPI003EBA627E
MRLRLLAVVALLVLAGCGAGPTATPSTTPQPTETDVAVTDTATPTPAATPPATTTPEREVRVRNGELPFDATAVFARTQALLGSDVAPPRNVYVSEQSYFERGSYAESDLFRWLGLTGGGSFRASAYVAHPNAVYIATGNQTATELETILAHEYVHIVQRRSGVHDRLGRRVVDGSTDTAIAASGVTEGAATYTAQAYWDRHIKTGESPRAAIERAYANATGARKYLLARYYFGVRYIDQRVDDPSELDSVYEAPPESSEALIHGPTEVVAAPTVSIESDWTEASRSRQGELFLRGALSTGLPDETAGRAAAGWGNDTIVGLADEGDSAYVWAHRWDDRANATEFEQAFAEWERPSDASYRLVRVDGETTVLLFGTPRFVTNATVERGDGIVVRT